MRGAIERGRRERQLVALVGRALAPGSLHIEAVAFAPRAGERAVDERGDADVGAAAGELVVRDHVVDHGLDEFSLGRLEIGVPGASTGFCELGLGAAI